MKEVKRKVDIVVISDVHLGTYGCHAKELLHYLTSIKPKIIVLNGDIIDMWQFNKRYWPKSHMKVIRYAGLQVYYRLSSFLKSENERGKTESGHCRNQ